VKGKEEEKKLFLLPKQGQSRLQEILRSLYRRQVTSFELEIETSQEGLRRMRTFREDRSMLKS